MVKYFRNTPLDEKLCERLRKVNIQASCLSIKPLSAIVNGD